MQTVARGVPAATSEQARASKQAIRAKGPIAQGREAYARTCCLTEVVVWRTIAAVEHRYVVRSWRLTC